MKSRNKAGPAKSIRRNEDHGRRRCARWRDCGRGAKQARIAQSALAKADLALLDQGGDFADGIIAFEGASLAGATFATFDKDTAKRFKKLGQDSLLLA